MNTQRPEWNDANNALVGNGVSMVTLYYLRRFLKFVEGAFCKNPHPSFFVSTELRDFLPTCMRYCGKAQNRLRKVLPGRPEKITDALGMVGSQYRGESTPVRLPERKPLSRSMNCWSLSIALQLAAQSIRAGKRDDGLFHAYNLVRFHGNELHVSTSKKCSKDRWRPWSAGRFPRRKVRSLMRSGKVRAVPARPEQLYTLPQ